MKNKTAQNKQKKSKINKKWTIPVLTGIVLFFFVVAAYLIKKPSNNLTVPPEQIQLTPGVLPAENIALPQVSFKSPNSLESILKARRTKRSFTGDSLDTKQVSQMLWAGQGVTSDWGGRTTPSAKSTYPLTTYIVVNNVNGLDQGLYQYLPGDRTPLHQLKTIKKGNFGEALFTAQNQNSFKNTPAIIIVTGNMARMAQAFGGVSQDKEVYLEAGHAAQNMYLQAESLKLGMVTISTFKDNIIRNIISIPEEETIIYLIPLGHPKE